MKSIIIILTVFIITIFSICNGERPKCTGNESICFFTEKNFAGDMWKWNHRMNYRDLPRQFHNNVGSYISNTNACFKNWVPLSLFNVTKGDFNEDFEFGKIIDGVSDYC